MGHGLSSFLLRRARAVLVVVGCGLAAALFVAFPGRPDSAALITPGSKPDIILITIDSLRADHLGLYGYDRPTSPVLDALASEAAVVRDHIAQAPYTKASIASLFTGRFPSSHKTYTVTTSFGVAMTGRVEEKLPMTDVLDPELWTLAGALSSAGYETVGLTTNPFLLQEFGFANGFRHYQFLVGKGEFVGAREVVRAGLAHLARPDRQPMFLWMHFMEPHSPYAPPADRRARFPSREPARIAPRERIPPWLSAGGPPDANYYEALYDAEIADVDAAVGEFVAAMREGQRWQQLVLVVTSDHGEEFFEHGGFEHNNTLFDEMLRVPLLIKAPGLPPGMREIQTQAVDLAPTLAAAAGAAVPAGLAGADLGPLLRRASGAEPMAFAERPGDRYTIRTREWKLISNLEGQDALYNLLADPKERVNLAGTETDRTHQLRERLGAVLAGAYKAGAAVRRDVAPVSPRTLERLKALGYVR